MDPDQNATTCYSKDNSRKPKSACELSQSIDYQSIVGDCSLETANSCNYDLMMRVDQRERKSVVYLSEKLGKWILTKML